jgi:hypothetical protein
MEPKRFMTIQDVKNMFYGMFTGNNENQGTECVSRYLPGDDPIQKASMPVQVRSARLNIAVERTCNLPVCFCSIEKAKET